LPRGLRAFRAYRGGVRTTVLAVIAALAVGATACTSDPPAAAPNVPAFTTPPPSSTAPADKPVPRTCGGLATLEEVTEILGAAVTGQTQPIVGVPEPKIGRTARLDCYYGIPAGQPVQSAAVWIGLANYTDAAAAQRRMNSTVETEREAGAMANDVAVGQDRGVLLNGQKRTLVAVRGKNTVVVTVIPDLVPADLAGPRLSRLADHALTPR
jgi:hypothetical protein